MKINREIQNNENRIIDKLLSERRNSQKNGQWVYRSGTPLWRGW